MQKPPVYGALTAPRLTPAQTVAELERKLEPATDWEIEQALAFLFANTAHEKVTDETELAAKRAGYMLACRGYPAAALNDAIKAFVGGRVVGSNDGFCPKPPVLGAEIAHRVSNDRDRLGRAKRVAEKAEEIQGESKAGPISDEVRERARVRIAELKAVSQDERENIRFKPPAHPELDQYRGEIGANGQRLPIRESLPSRIGYAGAPGRPVTAEDVAHLPDAPPRGTVAAAGAMRPIGGAFMPRLK